MSSSNLPAKVSPQESGLRFRYMAACLGLALPWITTAFCLQGLQPRPANDDPFYAKPVYWAVVEGRLQQALQGGRLTASSVAHVAPAVFVCNVFGWSFDWLCKTCALQQWVGACAVYALFRDLRAESSLALCGAAAVMLSPWYFCHGFTFMTDGPACAWICIAHFAYARGTIRRSASWWLIGSLCLGWACWIRQTDAMLSLLPLSILLMQRLWGWWPTADCLRMLIALGPLAASLLLLESGLILESSAARAADVLPRTPFALRLKQLVIACYGLGLIIGLFLLPLAPILISALCRSRSGEGRSMNPVPRPLIAAGCLMFGPLLITNGGACVTNSTGPFIQNGHLGPIFLSDMDEAGRWGELAGVSWPLSVWQIITVLAILVLTAAGACCRNWLRGSREAELNLLNGSLVTEPQGDDRYLVDRASRVIVIGCLLSCTVYAITVLLLVGAIMDRYWLFLLPLIAVVAVTVTGTHSARQADAMTTESRRGFRPQSLSVSFALLLGLWCFNTVMIHDYWAWNDARWQQVDRWLAAGFRAKEFDAGRDVNAWLRLDEDPHSLPRIGDSAPWWNGFADICIAAGPRPGWIVKDELPFSSWATGRTHSLLVLERKTNTRTGLPELSRMDDGPADEVPLENTSAN